MIKLRRDFSNASKQKLLSIVADVEKEKLSSFTDWMGDSYYKFQSWIGKLNIRNYMNDVDSYHKKVIDKNNASKKTIESIFKNVASVDTTYQRKLSVIKTNLKKWDKYIVQMENTINPGNGNFTAAYIENTFKNVDIVPLVGDVITPTISSGKITTLLQELINASNNNEMSSSGDSLSDGLKKYLELEEKILKNSSAVLSEMGKKDKDASLVSSVMSYLSSLCGCATKDTTETSDAVSNFISLFKASGNMELGLYKYYEKKLSAFQVSNLDKKFGKTMTGLTIATKLASAVNEGVDTYKIFTDDDSSAFDKVSQGIEMAGAVFDFGGASYTTALASEKYLRFVDSISKSKTAVNQILVDTRELKYTTSAAATKKIETASTAVAVIDVIISTGAAFVKRYGQVKEDGTVDMSDWASVGTYSALSGLNKVSSTLTLGAIHFDSDQVASELESDVSDFVKSDSWAAKEIRNQLEQGHWYNNVAAFGLSIGEAVCLVVTKGVQGVGKSVLSGFNKVSSALTLGTIHFDSDQAAGELESDVSDFVKSDSWAAKEIRNQLEQGHWYNNVAAFGLSTGEAAWLVGTKTVQSVGKGVKTVGSWISTGWNYVATNRLGV